MCGSQTFDSSDVSNYNFKQMNLTYKQSIDNNGRLGALSNLCMLALNEL